MALRYNLLVIDDEPEMGEEIKNYFEKRDFVVETALSGEEGLEKLRKQNFNVVLIDLCLPDMNGLEIIDKMNIEFIPSRIAILTGHGGEKEAIAALNMGGIVQAWFTKGLFTMEELYQRMKDLAQVISEDKLAEFFAIFDKAA